MSSETDKTKATAPEPLGPAPSPVDRLQLVLDIRALMSDISARSACKQAGVSLDSVYVRLWALLGECEELQKGYDKLEAGHIQYLLRDIDHSTVVNAKVDAITRKVELLAGIAKQAGLGINMQTPASDEG